MKNLMEEKAVLFDNICDWHLKVGFIISVISISPSGYPVLALEGSWSPFYSARKKKHLMKIISYDRMKPRMLRGLTDMTGDFFGSGKEYLKKKRNGKSFYTKIAAVLL